MDSTRRSTVQSLPLQQGFRGFLTLVAIMMKNNLAYCNKTLDYVSLTDRCPLSLNNFGKRK